MCNIWKRPRLYGCLISENQRFKEEKGRGRVWNPGYHKLEGRSDKNGEKCFKNYSASSTHLKIVLPHAQDLGNDFHPPSHKTWIVRVLCALPSLPTEHTVCSSDIALEGWLAALSKGEPFVFLLYSLPLHPWHSFMVELPWSDDAATFLSYVIQHKSCLDGNHNGCKKEWLRELES